MNGAKQREKVVNETTTNMDDPYGHYNQPKSACFQRLFEGVSPEEMNEQFPEDPQELIDDVWDEVEDDWEERFDLF